MGNAHPAMAPHGVYRCSGRDEWLALACRDDEDWQRLAQLLGADATLDLSARRAQATALDATIASWCAERTKHAAAAALQAAGIPAGPVNTTPDMTADPQVQAREFFVPLEQNVPVPGNPVHMPGMDSSQWTPCPKLGEHNAEVLAEWLGMDAADIDVLIADGVLADSPPG